MTMRQQNDDQQLVLGENKHQYESDSERPKQLSKKSGPYRQIPLMKRLDYSLSNSSDDEEKKCDEDEANIMDFYQELQTVLEMDE